MSNVEKKNVFLTGGAQGLGHAYIQRFLEEGANVFYSDVNETLGKSSAEELQSRYGKERVMFFPCDVTNDGQFKEAFDKAVSTFGQIDIMVNNAGILNEGIWAKMIEINVTGVVRGTKLAMDHMRKDKGGKGGRIVNISSIVGLIDHPYTPVYVATKNAVRSYSSSIAVAPELESQMGIEIVVLCPDVTITDLITKLDEGKFPNYDNLKEKLNERSNPMSTIVDGLFSLLHKDSINGAILLVTKEGSTFQKMERVSLGKEWPLVKATL